MIASNKVRNPPIMLGWLTQVSLGIIMMIIALFLNMVFSFFDPINYAFLFVVVVVVIILSIRFTIEGKILNDITKKTHYDWGSWKYFIYWIVSSIIAAYFVRLIIFIFAIGPEAIIDPYQIIRIRSVSDAASSLSLGIFLGIWMGKLGLHLADLIVRRKNPTKF